MPIKILGTRGIPAAHGGFETFAARLAPYLRDKGHDVLVYCQDDDGEPGSLREDEWEGIQRVHYCPKRGGPVGTMEFDLVCVRDAMKRNGVDLVLGYNTAIFNILQRVTGRRFLMNMDGIEWKRAKWGKGAKAWFWLNEIIGANFCNVAIADHPLIAKHVKSRCFKEPVMIPYGSDRITEADIKPVHELGLEPGRYFVSIARIEPENSILELVQAFSNIKTDAKCAILGTLLPENPYHQAVKAAAGPNVVFLGSIYETEVVAALRFYALCYLHGHQVGGTNPSLVEALGAGNAVLAHDNGFNRWTAGDGQFFFQDVPTASQQMKDILESPDRVRQAQQAAVERHNVEFQWESVLQAYESVLTNYAPAQSSSSDSDLVKDKDQGLTGV